MSLENLKSFDPFEDLGGEDKQANIHIRIQQRNGRKTLTTVQGLPKDLELKRILKVLKKEFSTNGNIIVDAELGEVIQLQGDQRAKVSDFLVDEKLAEKKSIKIHGF